MAYLEFISIDEALLLFNGEDGNGSCIAVYSLHLRRVVCRCLFPFRYLPQEARFLIRTDPRIRGNVPSPISKSFVPDPEVDIVTARFRLRHNTRNVYCVISTHRFRQMINCLLGKYSNRDTFNWEEWGPSVTRWLPYAQIEPTGARSIFGCRMLARGTPISLDSRSFSTVNLILLDFNPRPIQRGAVTDIEGESHSIIINRETYWKDPDSEVLIKSSLPYRAFTTHWSPRSSNFLFDGSNIIQRTVSCLLNRYSTNNVSETIVSSWNIIFTHFCLWRHVEDTKSKCKKPRLILLDGDT
jgi:hypothetical protein